MIKQGEQTIPEFVKAIENKHYIVKLEIKRQNIENRSFTYTASGIYENPNEYGNSEGGQTMNTDHIEPSITQVPYVDFVLIKSLTKEEELLIFSYVSRDLLHLTIWKISHSYSFKLQK